ncbi:HEAT repeat domain-containing protein [Streptomyces sp. A0958]|uniref:HEAT repeat domain-containing protein n=1 Tax=Streptomyces sp. A0958 TaxID=2563101 RepID=UPI00109E51DA|nr:HEAT repeat domain-containing protein [Streptomyces sp. A0958]THA64495.1 HEAT repeat domain-containing protein [Streptomyces sp. A0958]
MTMPNEETATTRALRGLGHADASVRLRAALAVGSNPDPRLIDRLVEQCRTEPDFSVREMLTWALTRHSPALTVPRLVGELRSERAQARSQALHTLSKTGDRTLERTAEGTGDGTADGTGERQAWPAITRALLTDADDEVARAAWRAAVVLVPEGEEPGLAAVLAEQLGRGERETQLSLSRALIALGEVVAPVLSTATAHPDPRVRQHALATQQLLRDPDAGFEFAIEEAKRMVALGTYGQEG